MNFYLLTLGILAVWRVTHLFTAEDGPWDVVVRIRRAAGNGVWGSLLDCFYCLSLWISAPFAYALASDWKERLLLWLALSAGAILAERLTAERGEARHAPAIYYKESEEYSDVLLRQQTSTVPNASDEQ